jgi:carboxyl-terminal processing protease
LQDYQRSLIIGSTSFGKATMQTILPLDSTLKPENISKPGAKSSELGYAKVTGGKLFRITNKTAQLTGVVPDVVLPDAFEAMDYTERSLEFALPSDTIIKNVAYTKSAQVPATQLSQQSRQRVASNPFFSNLQKVIVAMKAARSQNAIPLKWEAYEQWIKQEELPDEIEKSTDVKKVFTIENSAFDNTIYKLDDYQKEMNDYVVEDLIDDPYIAETYQIMLDYIKSTKP